MLGRYISGCSTSLIALAVLAGCAPTRTPEQILAAAKTPVEFKNMGVHPIEVGAHPDLLSLPEAKTAHGFEELAEETIPVLCGADENAPRASKTYALTGAAGVLAVYLIDTAFKWGQVWMTERLADYIKAYGAVENSWFYRLPMPGTPDGASEVPLGQIEPGKQQAFRCVRMQHVVEREGAKPYVKLDYLAQIEMDQAGTFIQVRPLRLYYAEPYNLMTKRIKAGFSLSVSAVWFDGRRSGAETVFTAEGGKAELDLSQGPVVKYYTTSLGLYGPLDKLPRHPLPPVSTKPNGMVPLDVKGRAGRLTPVAIRIQGAEQGDVPGGTQAVADFFKASSGDIAEILKGLAKEKVN